MQPLNTQLVDTTSHLHDVFTTRIFVAVCRALWVRMAKLHCSPFHFRCRVTVCSCLRTTGLTPKDLMSYIVCYGVGFASLSGESDEVLVKTHHCFPLQVDLCSVTL
ncbi:hypothetical protein M758_UG246000 [Ceratodon purpureus]|nr:hypothetical protein M758_UG246000 [Ceratodon purpureus]